MRCHGAPLFLFALVLAGLSTCARRGSAHGVDPIGLAIVERGTGDIRLRIDRPLSLAGVDIAVHIDASCAPLEVRARTLTAARAVDELELRCADALAGHRLRVDGLASTGLDAVLRAELADGTVHRRVVTASAPEVSLPETASGAAALFGYLLLGARHLLLGFDHLLFVLGTLLLEARPRRAALALTGFTLGHSATLGLAVLGALQVPAAWAEVGIASSLIWLAVAIARRDRSPASGHGLMVASFSIGLVHGLGFAGALTDAGIPRADLPLALFGFNLGIELAQLGLVTIAFSLVALGARLRMPAPSAARGWLAHGIGGLAVLWCIERVLAL